MWHSFTWKLDETGCFVLLFLLAQKMKLADGFMDETGLKLWNRQNSLGKKIETDCCGEYASFIDETISQLHFLSQ